MSEKVAPKVLVLQVAVRSPLLQLFDYLPCAINSDQLNHTPAIGARVLVPFGRRKTIGIVVSYAEKASVPIDKLKAIESVLDQEKPSVSSHMLTLAKWCSDYYHYPLGEVLHQILPASLKQIKSTEPRQKAWQISSVGREAMAEIKAPKQSACFVWMQTFQQPVFSKDAVNAGYSAAILRALKEKGLIEQVIIEPRMQPLTDINNDMDQNDATARSNQALQLNEAQSKAVDAIVSAKHYHSFLLDGVTGSGKTEVYLRAIEPLIALGQQVLVLVPEIGLTPQTIDRFRARFQGKFASHVQSTDKDMTKNDCAIAVWHSGMTDTERRAVWQNAKKGDCSIIIGTRSAIFVDMPKLGMIIVDEVHDASFKQQSGLRYHAADLARVRAKNLDIPVVLGSATPPLSCLVESKHPITRLSLPNRAGVAAKPSWTLVDLRGQKIKSGLSDAMLAKIRQHLDAGNQVLVFLNQRGYSPALICHQCGEIASCERCDAKMTLHEKPRRLLCHHCGAHRRDHHCCKACGSKDLFAAGVGTGQLETALQAHFPTVKALRIDRDSVRLKGSFDRMLKTIRDNQAQLLIGTQMLAKGHDFPNLTLVAVVNMDDGLFSADYHAVERLGALMVQVAGRAGRADKPGEVVVQTHQPDHPLLQLIVTQGYHAFAHALLEERKVVGLPPYGHVAVIRAESPDLHAPQALLQKLQQQLPSSATLRLVGPLQAPLAKKAGRFRYHLLVWADSRGERHRCLRQAQWILGQLPEAKRARWSIDVDPIDLS